MTAPGQWPPQYSTAKAARLAAFGVATPISRHSRRVEAGNRGAVIDVAARAASALRLGQRAEDA